MSPTLLFLTLVAGSLFEGEIVILGFAVLAAGRRFPLDPWLVVAGGTLGTIAGDQAVYWMGRLAKHPERVTWRGRPMLSPERRETLDRFFARHGGKAVFLLRYAFGLRTVGYFFAGAMRMSWRRFAVADFAGSLSWTGLLVALGWLVGRPLLYAFREYDEWLVAIPVAALLVWVVLHLQRRSQRRRSRRDPSVGAAEPPPGP